MYKVISVNDVLEDGVELVLETVKHKLIRYGEINNDTKNLKKFFLLLGQMDIPYIYPRIENDIVYLNTVFIDLMNTLCHFQKVGQYKDVFSFMEKEFPHINFVRLDIDEDLMFIRHTGVVKASLTNLTISYNDTPVYLYVDDNTYYVYGEDGSRHLLMPGEFVKPVDGNMKDILRYKQEYMINTLDINDIIYTDKALYHVLPGYNLDASKFVSAFDASLFKYLYGLQPLTMDEYIQSLSKHDKANLEFKLDILLRD